MTQSREKYSRTPFNEYIYAICLMPHPAFSVEDFCKDPQFIDWVLNPTDKSNRFWQAFLADYPHKATDIQTATNYVKTIHFREISPSERDLARLKERIWTDIETPVRDPQRPVRRSGTDPVWDVQWYRNPYWAAAAVVLLVASFSVGWWAWQLKSSLTYRTAYGQLQEIQLADGSTVTLNANSLLKVAHDLTDGATREVWLDGEAYFAIAKRPGVPFVVHTPEANVEVLGTEFNVNTRREQTNVVLHEGRVQLRSDNQSVVVMKPGDMATVMPKSRQIQLKSVQPDLYDAWKRSYIILDNKSLPEIINSLEDTFGVTIKLEDSQLATKKLTGKLRTDVVGDCIDNLAIILGVEVKKSGETYLFR